MCVFNVFHKISEATCYYPLSSFSTSFMHALVSFKTIFMLNYLSNLWSDHTVVFVIINLYNKISHDYILMKEKHMFQSINTYCFICDSDMFHRVSSPCFTKFLNVSVTGFFCFTIYITWCFNRWWTGTFYRPIFWWTGTFYWPVFWGIGHPMRRFFLIVRVRQTLSGPSFSKITFEKWKTWSSTFILDS